MVKWKEVYNGYDPWWEQHPPREGYKRCVVARRLDRLMQAVRKGWHFVLDNKGVSISGQIGTDADGSALRGDLMEKPEFECQADRDAADESLKLIEQSFGKQDYTGLDARGIDSEIWPVNYKPSCCPKNRAYYPHTK